MTLTMLFVSRDADTG